MEQRIICPECKSTDCNECNECYHFWENNGNYLDGYGKENCVYCGLQRTEEGHDGCIGTLKNVMNACCGHGQDESAYVQFNHDEYSINPNKYIIKGVEAVKYISEHSLVLNRKSKI